MTREDSEGGIRESAQRGRDAQSVGHECLGNSCDSVGRTGDGSDHYATGCSDGAPDGDGRNGGAPLALEAAAGLDPELAGAPPRAALAATDGPAAQGAATAAVREARPGARAAPRASARVEALEAFVAYLVDAQIVGDGRSVDTHEGRHRLQKHAYIAQELGIAIGYTFGFIRSGAFSTDLIVDTYRRRKAGGAGPLRPGPRAAEAFERIARGRGTEWLQVATFAVRDRGAEGAREALLGTRRARRDYGRGLISEVYGEVGSIMEGMGRAAK